MRAVWILLACAGCGDNVRPARLEALAVLPAGTQDIAFDREDVPVARTADGTVRRLVDERWRSVAVEGARALDFGSDTDGTLLVMASEPRTLHQLDGETLRPLGGAVLANHVHMPMQVPSGNRYVREIDGAQRSFVLSPGASMWAETPPMFFSRPLRAFDGTLYAAAAAGVQRFEADGTRSLAVDCAAVGKRTCTGLVLGAGEGRIVVADATLPELLVVDDGVVAAVPLPAGLVPVRVAVGAEVTVVLAKRDELNPADEVYFLYALRGDARAVELLDATSDPPSAETRLAVDHAGVVHVATTLLSRVMPP